MYQNTMFINLHASKDLLVSYYPCTDDYKYNCFIHAIPLSPGVNGVDTRDKTHHSMGQTICFYNFFIPSCFHYPTRHISEACFAAVFSIYQDMFHRVETFCRAPNLTPCPSQCITKIGVTASSTVYARKSKETDRISQTIALCKNDPVAIDPTHTNPIHQENRTRQLMTVSKLLPMLC